jgi:hypothetical protein
MGLIMKSKKQKKYFEQPLMTFTKNFSGRQFIRGEGRFFHNAQQA